MPLTAPVPPAWVAAIDEWIRHLTAGGSPYTTRRTRREQLQRCARTIAAPDPWGVEGPALLDWFAAQSWAVETRRSNRTTLRGFYRWGVESGRCSTNPALLLPSVRPSRPNPRPTPDTIYRFALAAATTRERRMLRLSAELGMRRAEVAQVRPDRDLIEDLDGWSLIVHGKGGRERLLPLPASLAADLRAAGPGYLFPGNDGGHLSPRWVGRLMTELLPDGWTMHSLRHRAGTRWWEESGFDLFVTQELLGHASPVTTQVYVARPNHRLRATVEGAARDVRPLASVEGSAARRAG